MLSFLLSPVMSFFSIRLYREALHSSWKRGLAYLAYLTFLFCILVFFLCQFLFLPVASSFADWLVQVTPEITVAPTGLSTEAHQPYLVKHPVFGALYLIDTRKNAEELTRDSSRALILIGKDNVIFQNPRRGKASIIDLRQILAKKNPNQTVRMTKPFMRMLFQKIEGFVIPIALLVLAPLFFIWKLVIALLYFLIAILLNLFRKEKFRTQSLFVLSCYAITPVTLIQAIHMSIPDLYFNLNFYFAFALTAVYLIYGMFVASRISPSHAAK